MESLDLSSEAALLREALSLDTRALSVEPLLLRAREICVKASRAMFKSFRGLVVCKSRSEQNGPPIGR